LADELLSLLANKKGAPIMVLSAVRQFSPIAMGFVQEPYSVTFDLGLNKLLVKDADGDVVEAIAVTGPKVLIFNIQPSDSLAFNENPIEWVLGDLDHQLSVDRKTLILLVGPPPSVIQPLVFNLVVDLTSPHVPGIRTSNMFISTELLLTSSVSENLIYDSINGAFTFESGWLLQPGQLLVFLKHKNDILEHVTVNISLIHHDSQAQIRFADSPIRWLTSQGTPPPWIQVHRQEDGASVELINDFFAGSGLAAPFRFVIEVNGVLVESPDPILVNTTIGDG
jgi:hypothetical protein